MNTNSGPKGAKDSLLLGSGDNLANGEIDTLRMFAMQEGRRDPSLIRDLDIDVFGSGSGGHQRLRCLFVNVSKYTCTK
jgi:hypothetical protein